MQRLKFSEIFSSRRKQLGLTQGDVASYVGVSNAAVSKWEQGLSYPELTLLPKVATLLNVTIDTLLGYDPQLTQHRIRELYEEFAKRFGTEGFEQVQRDMEKIINEYYSCYPFLITMAQLYLNYYAQAPQPEVIFARIIELCNRIMTLSEDYRLAYEARMLHAMVLLISNKPKEMLQYIGEDIPIQYGVEKLISQAHVMLGDSEKAKLTLQASTFQYLLVTISSATESLILELDQPQHFDQTVERVQGMINLFHIDTLNVNLSLVFYYKAAIGYMLQQKKSQALQMLEHYYRTCCSMTFPLRLRGDDYFYLIDDWIARDMHLGAQAPRDEQSIKKDLLHILSHEPILSPLHEDARYKAMVSNLKHQLRL